MHWKLTNIATMWFKIIVDKKDQKMAAIKGKIGNLTRITVQSFVRYSFFSIEKTMYYLKTANKTQILILLFCNVQVVKH